MNRFPYLIVVATLIFVNFHCYSISTTNSNIILSSPAQISSQIRSNIISSGLADLPNDLIFEQEDQNLIDKFNGLFDNLPLLNELYPDNLKNITLPAGVSKTIMGKEVTIALVRAYFSVNYVMMDIVVRLKWEEDDGNNGTKEVVMMFGAWNVKVYYDRGWPEELSLILLKDVDIPLGSKVTLTLNGNFDMSGDGYANIDNATSLSINCADISTLEIHAIGQVSINDSNIKKVTRTNNVFTIFNEPVAIDFTTDIYFLDSDFYFSMLENNDYYFTFGETDLIFKINNVIADFSTRKSSEAFLTSPNELLSDKKNAIWKGVYINNVEFYLPATYLNEDGQRLSFNANDVIFDSSGLTAGVSLENLDALTNQNATLAKMPVILQDAQVEVLNSTINELSFSGEINPSILKDGQMVNFSSTWNNTTFNIAISYEKGSQGGRECALIPATVNRYTGSLTIDKENNIYTLDNTVDLSFSDEAVLKGLDLSINGLVVKIFPSDFEIEGIRSFELKNLDGLNTYLKNFPINFGYTNKEGREFNTIKFSNNRLELPLTICLHDKMSGGSGGTAAWEFGGGGMLELRWEKDNREKGVAKFIPDKIRVPDINVWANFEAFEFEGSAQFYENRNNTSGFAGDFDISINLSSENTIGITGAVEFGSHSLTETSPEFRYWHVSLGANELGIPLYGEALILDGLKGGIANHMAYDFDSDGFIPNLKNGLFLSMNTQLELVEVCEADAGFQMQFNKNYGLAYMAFTARVSATPEKIQELTGSLVDGYNKIAGICSNISETINKMDNIDVTQLNEIENSMKNAFPDISNSLKKSRLDVEVFLKCDYDRELLYGKGSAFINLADIVTGNKKEAGEVGHAGSAYFYLNPRGDSNGKFFIHAGYKVMEMSLSEISELPMGTWDPLGIDVNIAKANLGSARAYFMVGQRIPAMPSMADLGINNVSLPAKPSFTGSDSGRGVAFGFAVSCGFNSIDFLGRDFPFYASVRGYLGLLMQLKYYESITCGNEIKTSDFGINNWYANASAFAGVSGEAGIILHRDPVPVVKMNFSIDMATGLFKPSWFSGLITCSGKILLVNYNLKIPINLGEQCAPVEVAAEAVQLPIFESVYPTMNPDNTPKVISTSDKPYIKFNYDFNREMSLFNIEGDTNLVTLKCDRVEIVSGLDNSFLETRVEWSSNSAREMFIVPVDLQGNEQDWPPQSSDISLRVFITLNDSSQIADTLIRFSTGIIEDKLQLSSIKSIYPIIDQDYFFIEQTNVGFVELKNQTNLLVSGETYVVEFINESKTEATISSSGIYNSPKLSYNLPSGLENGTRYKVRIIDINKNELFSYYFKTSTFNTFSDKIEGIGSIIAQKGSSFDGIISTFSYVEPFGQIELYGSPYYNNHEPLVVANPFLYTEEYTDISISDAIFDFFKYLNYPQPYPSDANFIIQPLDSWEYSNEKMLTQSIFPFVYSASPSFFYWASGFFSYWFENKNIGSPNYSGNNITEYNLPMQFSYAIGDAEPNILNLKYLKL